MRGPGLLCTGQDIQQNVVVAPGLGRQGGGLDLSTTRSPRPTRSIVQRTHFVVERCGHIGSRANLVFSKQGIGRAALQCRTSTSTSIKHTHFQILAPTSARHTEVQRFAVPGRKVRGTELRNCQTHLAASEDIYATVSPVDGQTARSAPNLRTDLQGFKVPTTTTAVGRERPAAHQNGRKSLPAKRLGHRCWACYCGDRDFCCCCICRWSGPRCRCVDGGAADRPPRSRPVVCWS